MTVPGNVRLTRHIGDLDDDGHDIYGGFSADLDDLADVIAPTPAVGDILRYDGSDWVNYSGHYEPVIYDFGTGPELVFDAGDIVMEWFD